MSDALLTVRAAEGRRVVTPSGEDVPSDGFKINARDPWWARALASGDLVELKGAEQQRASSPAAPAEEKK